MNTKISFQLACVLLISGAFGGPFTAFAAETRPNILLICTDEQFAGAMSAAGDPNVSTPAMDSIAANGVSFSKAYSPQASCVPARASFMTGLMPDQNGVNYNGGNMTLTGNSAAKYLKDAGYRTGYVGKWHLPRSITDRNWSGFDYTASIKNNSVDFDIPKDVRTFLETDSEKPFFLVASFVNPHDICEWARMLSGISDEFNNGDIGTPPTSLEKLPQIRSNSEIPEREPSAIRQAQSNGQLGTYPTREWSGDSGIEKWRKYLWGYYRMIETVDVYIDEVLSDVERLGYMDDTVIIFISDHGEGMGSHQWNQKYIHYEESCRIPFIVSWKGNTLAGTENNDRLVNLGLDLFPTIFDFAGIEKPEYMMGLSAMSQAMGEGPVLNHDYIVSEIEIQQVYNKRSPYLARMVRSQRYKYVRYNSGFHTEQLFDMELDPGETVSLVYDPANKFVLNEHRRMLDEWVRETGDSWGYFTGNDFEETDILSGGHGLHGWRDSWRYGGYYAGSWPWIYHMDFGWQYIDESLATNDSVYVFNWNDQSWRLVSSTAPYWYFDYSKTSWVAI